MAKPAQVKIMYVIDASVVIKWFSEEEYTDKAIEIRNEFFKGTCELAAPDLILYEVSNALRFNPNFNEEAFKYKTTIYDAFYAALANEIGFEFVTADIKLFKKIKDLGFVRHISEF